MNIIEDYDQIPKIPMKSQVKFQEFILDRHQNPKESVKVIGELQRIILDNEGLSADERLLYYPGIDVSSIVPLSICPFYRLVLMVGFSSSNVPIYKTVQVNKYFLHTKLQKIEYEEAIQNIPVAPQNILGYESYQIGQKFKK